MNTPTPTETLHCPVCDASGLPPDAREWPSHDPIWTEGRRYLCSGCGSWLVVKVDDNRACLVEERGDAAEPAERKPVAELAASSPVVAVVRGEPIYQVDTCAHEVVPIDANWGRCTKCGDNTFPLSDEAAWGGPRPPCRSGTFASPEPTVHVPSGDVCPLCGAPVTDRPSMARPNAEAVLGHRDCQSARGASWVLA